MSEEGLEILNLGPRQWSDVQCLQRSVVRGLGGEEAVPIHGRRGERQVLQSSKRESKVSFLEVMAIDFLKMETPEGCRCRERLAVDLGIDEGERFEVGEVVEDARPAAAVDFAVVELAFEVQVAQLRVMDLLSVSTGR